MSNKTIIVTVSDIKDIIEEYLFGRKDNKLIDVRLEDGHKVSIITEKPVDVFLKCYLKYNTPLGTRLSLHSLKLDEVLNV